jgi:hypothetical protein
MAQEKVAHASRLRTEKPRKPEARATSLNPIHGAAASNVQSNHEGSTNFRQKRKRLASLKERIQRYE